VLVGLPFPLMWFVDVERGKREGVALSRELNKTTMATPDSYDADEDLDGRIDEERAVSEEVDDR
jgi:UMF1 family MFS transporter